MTTRRTFLTGILGVLAAPLAAEAQPAGKVYRIGYLGSTNAIVTRHGIDAWRQALRERGWVEGQNLVIEFRWGEGKLDRLPALAAELVALKVDLIVASVDAGIHAAKNATATIPIVMLGVSDPVAQGLVQSLARPGGNLTGLTWDPTPDVYGKMLELLRETVPAASRVAFLWNPDIPTDAPYWAAVRSAATGLGVQLQSVELRRANDLDAAVAAMVRQRADAVLVLSTQTTYIERARLAALALQHRLPTMFDMRENVAAGGLMAYGINLIDLMRRSTLYVDKILRGAKPADLPIEQPTTFELVINLTTAKALALTIPQSVLFRADEVIQ